MRLPALLTTLDEEIAATVELPEDGQISPHPAVVLLQGLTRPTARLLAQARSTLLASGYAVLHLDYRGMGLSAGTLRAHVDPHRQAEDVCAGVTYLEQCPEVDPERIVLWGVGLGGGVALQVAALDERVRAVVATAPIADGSSWLRRRHTTEGWERLMTQLRVDRANRARGTPPTYAPLLGPHPQAILGEASMELAGGDSHPPIGDAGMSPKDGLHRPGSPACTEGYVTVASVEALLAFRPESFLDRLAGRPTLLLPPPPCMTAEAEQADRCRRAAGAAALACPELPPMLAELTPEQACAAWYLWAVEQARAWLQRLVPPGPAPLRLTALPPAVANPLSAELAQPLRQPVP